MAVNQATADQPPLNQAGKRFDVFLSYSHAAAARWAADIQKRTGVALSALEVSLAVKEVIGPDLLKIL